MTPIEDKEHLDKIGKVVCVEFLDHFVTFEGSEKTTIEAFGILEDEDDKYISLVQTRTKHSSATDYSPFEREFKIVKSAIKNVTEYEIKEESR